MLNKFCKKPLYEVTRTLARVAMGAQKAELVIRNARLVNVCTAEIQEASTLQSPRAALRSSETPHTASARRQPSSTQTASILPPALWTGTSTWNRP